MSIESTSGSWQKRFVLPNTVAVGILSVSISSAVSAIMCGGEVFCSSTGQVFLWGAALPTGAVFLLSEIAAIAGGCLRGEEAVDTSCCLECCLGEGDD